MLEDLSNDFLLGDEGDHAEGAPHTQISKGLLDSLLDEPRPALSESGAFFRRELGVGYEIGFVVDAIWWFEIILRMSWLLALPPLVLTSSMSAVSFRRERPSASP